MNRALSSVSLHNDTPVHCEGVFINDSNMGECWCECHHEVHVDVGINSPVGVILGIHMTPVAVASYTLMGFVLLLLLFSICYPIILWFENLLKKLLKIFKKIPKVGESIYRFLGFIQLPFSGWLIVLGVIFGAVFKLSKFSVVMESNRIMFFDEEILFLFLIPPLILVSGFFFEKTVFLKNFPLITAHAVFGTLTNMILIGFSLWLLFTGKYSVLDCFLFSSLISAIDPVAIISVFHQKKVNDRIDIILESESILNDAVSIVFFTVFKALRLNYTEYSHAIIPLVIGKFFWVIFVGLVVGILCGLIASFLLRFTFHNHDAEKFQIVMLFTFAIFSYFLSESLHSSGIFGIMVCSIVMSQYLKYRLSKKNRDANRILMKMMASVCEGLIFFYLGMAIVVYSHSWDWGLIIATNIMLFIYRFLVVFLISLVFNVLRALTKRKIVPWNEVFVQAFAGIRGAVSFALVFSISDSISSKNAFVTTTMTVIFVTIFFQSSVISSLVYLLRIKKKRLPLDKKIKQFQKMRDFISKVIVYLPVEHSKEEIKELDSAFKDDLSKKKLLASETTKNFLELSHYTDDAVEIRIGEHAFHELKETEKFDLSHVEECYLEEEEEMKILQDLYNFLLKNKKSFDFGKLGKTSALGENQIFEAGEKIHDLVLLRDRISFLIAKLHQQKYEDKVEGGIKKDYPAWVIKTLSFFDNIVQVCVNRKGIWKGERKFLRSYFSYRNYFDLHMFESILETKQDSILETDVELKDVKIEKDTPKKPIKVKTFKERKIERSMTLGTFEKESKEDREKEKRLNNIRGEILTLQKELKVLQKYITETPGTPSLKLQKNEIHFQT